MQSFHGHQSNCKIHLGELKNEKRLERLRKTSQMGLDAISIKRQKQLQEKEQFTDRWIEENHKCEKCGKIMTTYFGSGRFCSRKCANSKSHSDEAKIKIANSLREKSIEDNRKRKQKYYYGSDMVRDIDYVTCPYCEERFAEVNAAHLKQHNKTINDVKAEFGGDYPLISFRTHEKRSKNSTSSVRQRIEQGNHVGWNSRKVSSYAENFWEKVLINNNIAYRKEYVVKKKDLGLESKGNYFLDFLLSENIDLEIDGKQHTYDDRIQHDKIRDKALANCGYKIYRIPWINPKDEASKAKVKEQINNFISWYENVT